MTTTIPTAELLNPPEVVDDDGTLDDDETIVAFISDQPQRIGVTGLPIHAVMPLIHAALVAAMNADTKRLVDIALGRDVVDQVQADYERRDWRAVARAIPGLVAECRAHGQQVSMRDDLHKSIIVLSDVVDALVADNIFADEE